MGRDAVPDRRYSNVLLHIDRGKLPEGLDPRSAGVLRESSALKIAVGFSIFFSWAPCLTRGGKVAIVMIWNGMERDLSRASFCSRSPGEMNLYISNNQHEHQTTSMCIVNIAFSVYLC